MNQQLHNQLFARWIELEADWPLDWWIAALVHSVHFKSCDNNGGAVDVFYSPSEKLSHALTRRNWLKM